METMQITSDKKFHRNIIGMDIHLDNAIKKSAVREFVNKNISKPGKAIEELSSHPQKGQSNNLSEHLLHLKSSCNNVRKDITMKQYSSCRLKDEAGFKQGKSKAIQTQRSCLENKIMLLSQNNEKVKAKTETVVHTLKTYQHILERMRKDDIKHQLKKNQLKKLQKLLEKQLQDNERQFYAAKKFQQLSLVGLQDANLGHIQQFGQRRNQISTLSRVVVEKIGSDHKKQEREEQTHSIQEMAAGDLQDAQLIRMKKFLSVQQFLKVLLKEKAQKRKEYFQPYQIAFYKIKSSTTSKDAESMKNQFFNFEQYYSEKTNWVKHLESNLEQLEQERKVLDQKLKALSNNQLSLLESFQNKSPQQNYINFRQLSKNSLQSEELMMQLRSWIHHIASKFNISFEPNNNLMPIFQKICHHINIYAKNCENQKQTLVQQSHQRNYVADLPLSDRSRDYLSLQKTQPQGDENQLTSGVELKDSQNAQEENQCTNE